MEKKMIKLEFVMVAAAAALVLLTTPAQPMGLPEGPPKEPPVVTPEPPKERPPVPDDNDPQPLFSQPDQMPCCTRDGVVLYHAPLGFDRAGVRAYCAALDVTLIPACKTWVRK